MLFRTRPVTTARWRLARRQQAVYQLRKAMWLRGQEQHVIAEACVSSERTCRWLSTLGMPEDRQRIVVEVGSGAHGLIWRWPVGRRIAVDPLAVFYRQSFGFLQANGPHIVAARGEELPLADRTADVVLSDNVLDHVQAPLAFLRECARILRSDGLLYLTVDVHHPIYGIGARAYNALCELGIELKVPAFPSHPFHFMESEMRSLIAAAGLDIVSWHRGRPGSPMNRSKPVALLTRAFFKNVRLTIAARRNDHRP